MKLFSHFKFGKLQHQNTTCFQSSRTSRGFDNAALPNLIFSANFDKQKTNNRADVFFDGSFYCMVASQVNRKCQKKVESTPSFLTLFDPSSRKYHLLFEGTGYRVFSTLQIFTTLLYDTKEALTTQIKLQRAFGPNCKQGLSQAREFVYLATQGGYQIPFKNFSATSASNGSLIE